MTLAEMSAHSLRSTSAREHRPGVRQGVEACLAQGVPA